MKFTRLNVKDKNGKPVPGWYFKHEECSLVGMGFSRKAKGWTLVAPDNCVRFFEGNWIAFVPEAKLVVSNYGWTVDLS